MAVSVCRQSWLVCRVGGMDDGGWHGEARWAEGMGGGSLW